MSVTQRSNIITALCLALAATPALAQSGPGTKQKTGPAATQPLRIDDDGRVLGWALCPVDPLANLVTKDTGVPADGPTTYTADTAESSPEQARLAGDVHVTRGDQRLAAPEIVLDRQKNIVHAPGGLQAGTPALGVQAGAGDMNLDTDTADLRDARYYLPQRNAQGSAGRVVDRRQDQKTDLDEATYSTCQRDAEVWRVRATEMHLDHAAGRGEAWHAKIDIEGVPVLYLPYLSFPLNNDRQSGFLAPKLGFDSASGLDLAVPYYWNIAPNYDATITPRYIAERGLLLGTEFRFLTGDAKGITSFEFLPNDRDRDGRDRGSFHFFGSGRYGPFSSALLYDWASDDNYFRDLGNGLDITDTDYLERRLDTYVANPFGNLLIRFRGYQTLNGEDFTRPKQYAQLPQVAFWNTWIVPNQVSYELHSEATRFTHPDQVEGSRFFIEPALSLPLQTTWGFLTPRLALNATAYQLDYRHDQPDDYRDSPTRVAPVASLDTGLIFDRPLTISGTGFTQTLEPRLYYLRVPYRRQTDIPLFDTTTYSESYDWLFYDNRFAGIDRLGDANQLTTAISSRLLGASDGVERLRVSVGQIQYFSDRKVQLGADSPTLTNNSDLVAEATLRLDQNWYARAATLWDTTESGSRRTAYDLRYHDADGRILNVAYRYANGVPDPITGQTSLEQIDLAGHWPINPRWRVFGRYNYSLLYSHTTDTFAGFEYGDCCWAVRLLGRQYREYPQDAETKNAVMLEIELKGLTSVGASIDRFLDKSIIGYQRAD